MSPTAGAGEALERGRRAELPVERFGRALLVRLQARADRTRAGRWTFEFLMFGLKQAWACLFGGAMLALLLGTHLAWPAHAPLARYDFLVLAAATIQAALLLLRMESRREALAILIFHVVGTAMELFKTRVGSWTYPEPSLLRLGGVPLFSGFMYASVGSFIARSWRIMDLRFTAYPPRWKTWLLAAAIYLNFFTHHWLPDARWILLAATAWLYRGTWVVFRPDRTFRRMPMLLAFVLIALFIYAGENLGTFSHAWLYPSQAHGWTMVGPQKLTAWLLLMIVSFVLVTTVSPPRAADPPDGTPVLKPRAQA